MKRKATAKSAMVRCAVYTRKSTDEGLEQEFNSLDAQREAGEAYIVSQKCEGWLCLPDQYDDGGYSGGNMERPALRRLLADIAAGKIDCVVVYKVDRLSRSLMDFARIMEVFERHNVSFVSVTQQINTSTPMGRLMLNVLLSFAQFEREIIGERIRDKIAAQRRKGKWAGGVPVLGYDVDRSGNSPKLAVNAQEAACVRAIFDLYLQHGSLLAVLEQLTERGWYNKEWKTKKGEQRGGAVFDKGSLYALLTNPIYIGKIRHKTELYDGEHEPIVSPEVFRRVQARLQRNGRSGGVEVRNRHGALLKGLLVCKACQRAMVHTFTGKDGRRYRYYTCARAIKSGRKACPSRSLPAAEIEQAVVDEIRCITEDQELRAEVLRQAQSHWEGELEKLRIERSDLEQELARHHAEVRALAVSGNDTIAATATVADLHDRIARGETRLAELRARVAELDRERLDDSDVAGAFAGFETIWNALSPREQARVLSLLVARVEFDVEDQSMSVAFHPSAIRTLADQHTGAVA